MAPAELVREMSAYLGWLVEQYGSLGIAAAMFAESAGVPFASAVVILTSGSIVFSGKVSFWAMLAASTAGITLGSVFSYSLGFLSSVAGRKIKAFFPCKPAPPVKKKAQKRSRVRELWEKYGTFSVFMGQFWGVTRTFISFPAGAMHMNILLFTVYTALGGALFSLAVIGFSIALTGAMGLLLRLLQLALGLPPWIWAISALFLAVVAYYYRRCGWKISPAALLSWGRSRFTRKK